MRYHGNKAGNIDLLGSWRFANNEEFCSIFSTSKFFLFLTGYASCNNVSEVYQQLLLLSQVIQTAMATQEFIFVHKIAVVYTAVGNPTCPVYIITAIPPATRGLPFCTSKPQ